MSHVNQLKCDGCETAIAYDAKAALPQGWRRLITESLRGYDVERHWCPDCFRVAAAAVRQYHAAQRDIARAAAKLPT